MNDVTIIDRFLDTFSRYIDSGFGLLQGEVAFLTATLIVIDMTIAGLYWAMSHATGQGEDVIAKLLLQGALRRCLRLHHQQLQLAGQHRVPLLCRARYHRHRLGHHDGELLATGPAGKDRHRRGRADLGADRRHGGLPEVFVNLDPIVVLFIARLVVILCFFVLAVQLFITLIEFKLTTLAGFVLIPFALWNKTSFLAEKVLGNVVSSGIKVLVLAVIVGIGSGLFAEFRVHPDEPSIDHALVVMLASLALLALGIFGPGIATGLVSGAPQLGAGAMAGAAVGAVGTGVAIGAAATGVGGAVMAGARMAPAAAKLAGAGARAATSAAGSARSAFQPVPPLRAAGPRRGGWPGQCRQDRSTGGRPPRRVRRFGCRAEGGRFLPRRLERHRRWRCWRRPGRRRRSGRWCRQLAQAGATRTAKRMHRRQQITHAATTAAHTLRGGDGGGSGQGPSLRDSDT